MTDWSKMKPATDSSGYRISQTPEEIKLDADMQRKAYPAGPNHLEWPISKEEREKYQADFIAKHGPQYTQLYHQEWPRDNPVSVGIDITKTEIDKTIIYNYMTNCSIEGGSLSAFDANQKTHTPESDQTVIAIYHYITDEKPTIYNHLNLFVDAKPKTHTPEGGRYMPANDTVQLYYSCTDCDATLDPGTTRFAELNNHAMRQDWYIQWGHNGYDPYCPQCYPKRGFSND